VQALDLVVREVGVRDRPLEGAPVQHALLLGVAEQGLEQLVRCSNRGDSGFLLPGWSTQSAQAKLAAGTASYLHKR
jgi:hypothetical protein